MSLEDAIRQEAAALGFSACGFAAAAPLTRGPFLEGWLDAGFAGQMHYLARRPARRLTVAGILPDARTVISLAVPYAPPPLPAIDCDAELRGRIAAYTVGPDYHDTIGAQLDQLADFITARAPGTRCRPYVDTGAVLEREWAVRGGLGWFGKNTMLLSTRAGSWFFLAELVTTLALTPDEATEAHCGRCTSCLDACPTGALEDGLVMNAPKCISYLTIEHRGAVPRTLRPRLGAWIFGCDICQTVCPWNESDRPTIGKPASATPGSPQARAPQARAPQARAPQARAWVAPPTRPPSADVEWLYPRLTELVTLDEPGFRARYARTAIARTKRRGLLRNVAVALGNATNPAAVAPLTVALCDPEPLVRAHAAWALGAHHARGHSMAADALIKHRGQETDPVVDAEIAAALS